MATRSHGKFKSAHSAPDLSTARAFAELGDGQTALEYYGQFFRTSPFVPVEAWQEAAALTRNQGLAATTEACLRRAIATNPSVIQPRLDLAALLSACARQDEAVDLCHDVLAIHPGHARTMAILGNALISLGRLEEAGEKIDQALIRDPASIEAHLARGRLKLLDGYFDGAWDDMSWRWKATNTPRPYLPCDNWDQDRDLSRRSVMVWADEDDAATLHLLRYLPRLTSTGAEIWVHIQDKLMELVRQIGRSIRVLPLSSPQPADRTFDYHIPFSDLPRLFGTGPSTIPPAPYISAEPQTVAISACTMLKVGLNWHNADPSQSLPLSRALRLLSAGDVKFFNLLPGRTALDIADHAHPTLITDLSKLGDDYAHLANLISSMDLIITVDGPLAHLAAAMGKDVWVMLSTAPDWRWMVNRDDSPWYACARLFRQTRPGQWDSIVNDVLTALDDRVQIELLKRRRIAEQERKPIDIIKNILSSHARDGDLIVDIGCESGQHAQNAADLPIDDLQIMAIDCREDESALLADTIAIMGLHERVEVICAAMAQDPGPAVISPLPRCGGNRVFPLPDWVQTPVRRVDLFSLLAERPNLNGRRLLLRLGRTGNEDDILRGLGDLRPAVITFQHQDNRSGSTQAAAWLRDQNYQLLCFGHGPIPAAFIGQDGQILALAPDCTASLSYDDAADPNSLAAMHLSCQQAQAWSDRGKQALNDGQVNEAGIYFAKALFHDGNNLDANVNLGGLLRGIGRGSAAAACWTRALAKGAAAPLRGNLGKLLMDIGQHDLAEYHILKSMEDMPDNPRLQVIYALLERDQGRTKQALFLLERAERLEPGVVPRTELATTLLKSGHINRGLVELAHRPTPALPPLDLPVWQGHRLDGQWILVRDDNNPIDTIALARFIPQLVRLGGLVSVECVPEAARLLTGMGCVEQAISRGMPVPPMDTQITLTDIPRLLGTTRLNAALRDVPYLSLPDHTPPVPFPADGRLNVGIAWAKGSNRAASLPIDLFLSLTEISHIRLYSLQQGPSSQDLAASGADLIIKDVGSTCSDLADQAALIAGLDLVIATDCVQAHLAGAMGKPVWVLLPCGSSWHWMENREDSIWYPSMRVFHQPSTRIWTPVLQRIKQSLAAMAAGKKVSRQ